MANQITAAMSKIASFLNLQPSLPSTTTNQIDLIEERQAAEKEQVYLKREQDRIAQEMAQCQSSYQQNKDSLDALLAERENLEDKVEALYMKLYSSFHWILDDDEDNILQEKYHGSNEVYKQQCHQKCTLERRLIDIDNEIERLDVEKGEIREREEILLEEQLALDLGKESLDERKRSLGLVILDSKAWNSGE